MYKSNRVVQLTSKILHIQRIWKLLLEQIFIFKLKASFSLTVSFILPLNLRNVRNLSIDIGTNYTVL